MYCKKCGSLNDDKLNFCTNCGESLHENATKKPDGISNIWFGLLGFFVPILGLIFFVSYQDNNSKRAKASLKGAIIGFISPIVIGLIYVITVTVFAAYISWQF